MASHQTRARRVTAALIEPHERAAADTSAAHTSGVPAGARGRRRTWSAYARMGRLVRYENFIGVPIALTLMPWATVRSGRTALLVVLVQLAFVGFCCATGAFDDIQGYRDGTDRQNYEASDETGLRSMWRKPLLTGDVTDAQAVRFAWSATAFGIVMTVLAWLAAGRPWWFLPAYLAVAFFSVQYSYGLKFSYRGGQELVLFTSFFAAVFFPYTLVTGTATATATVVALVAGLWVMQISSFSNSHDVEGDRASGRRTVAVRTTPEGNLRFIVALFIGDWILLAVSLARGWISLWYLPGLLLVLGVQVVQLREGVVRRRYLAARHLGWTAIRLAAVTFIVVGIGANWL